MATSARVSAAAFEPATVNVRVKLAALWVSMMLIVAFVDIFGLFRADYRADIEAGEVGGFTIGQSFLLGTTIYIAIPSLMVFLVTVLRPRLNRIVNIALAVVYALTIIGAAIGEWNYYLLASAIELGLLAAMVYYALTWPRASAALGEMS